MQYLQLLDRALNLAALWSIKAANHSVIRAKGGACPTAGNLHSEQPGAGSARRLVRLGSSVGRAED
ncbi:MAG: hypothetical protein DME86_10550 [Verrucomicrobia bacterium]|nr:MAG: hypothetical protein DME86_10550 [Verrucomicrobiota bacterium]